MAKQNALILRLTDLIADEVLRMKVNKLYYRQRDLELNPLLFLHPGDKLYLITSRNKRYLEITKEWVKRFFPNAKLILTDLWEPEGDIELKKWYLQQAKRKARALKQHKIDVYFEDCPEVVEHLRKLVPNCKIIQYGARLWVRNVS